MPSRLFILYFPIFILLFLSVSPAHPKGGISACIRATATVAEPIGLSSSAEDGRADFSSVDIVVSDEGKNENIIYIQLPDEESAICLVRTTDGREYQYPVTAGFLNLGQFDRSDIRDSSHIESEITVESDVSLITVIYTEN